MEPLAPAPIGRAEQWATRCAFFIAGLAIAAWAPLVPFAKARAGLDEGSLGLLLLCLGIGSLIAMPFSGLLAGRFGCRWVIVISSLFVCLALPLLATASHVVALGGALFLFGAAVGSVDCVVNIQAVIVERASGRSMMSGFHGLFSVGGIVGAGGVSLLLMLGVSPLGAAFVVVGCLLATILASIRGLLPYGSASSGPLFALPRGVVLFLGVLCFIMFLTEGAVLDWSAVFLHALRGVDQAHAGLGYAAFATTMTIGRLTGDAIVRQLGGLRVIAIGGVLAAGGLALAVGVPHWLAGMVGFSLVGAGCSNIVPVLFTAVGKQQTMPEHVAVPAISTLGYAGILVGPAMIGFIAKGWSLPFAFALLAVALVGVAASSRWLRV
ncbi:MAG: MFS transporter [Verrucomicrobiota bacterium JB022]|nr:MFS transporter [Verrucomicrobiota bacterium JB022]